MTRLNGRWGPKRLLTMLGVPLDTVIVFVGPKPGVVTFVALRCWEVSDATANENANKEEKRFRKVVRGIRHSDCTCLPQPSAEFCLFL